MTEIVEMKKVVCGWTLVCKERSSYSRKTGRQYRDGFNTSHPDTTPMTRRQAQRELGDPSLRGVRL